MLSDCWDSRLLRAKFIRETEEDLSAAMGPGVFDWWNVASMACCGESEWWGLEEIGPCALVEIGRRAHGQESGARTALGD